MAAAFADQATLALELADARSDQQHLATVEDRDRIARDLHDHVVQQIYAIGLNLASLAGTIGPARHADRLNQRVEDIDTVIRQIRTSIFHLSPPPRAPTTQPGPPCSASPRRSAPRWASPRGCASPAPSTPSLPRTCSTTWSPSCAKR